MGKNLISQARGKGGPRYRAPSFNYKGKAKHKTYDSLKLKGKITDLLHCAGHSAPLAQIEYENGDKTLIIAPEGIKVGDDVEYNTTEINVANTMSLENIPEGTLIYNIESQPGDGGKFVRAGGVSAKVVTKHKSGVVVQLPSKKQKEFNPLCRASIGIIAGGGRTDKPLLKAGNAYYKMKAKNKLWPHVCGQSMNAVDHPHGGSSSAGKNYPYSVSRNAPPGAKVGAIASRRTGRRKK